jgi:hypothetical protein
MIELRTLSQAGERHVPKTGQRHKDLGQQAR